MNHSQPLSWPPSRFFPPPESAGPEGLVVVGGELTTETLLEAYQRGIFPWPSGSFLAWWSPDPRAIVEFEAFHISHRLARTLAQGKFRVTCDQAFSAVIGNCGTAQHRRFATWITPTLKSAYDELHRCGYAHSVETWLDERLVGGVYGVALGAMFAAESMFHLERDASKVALVGLVRHLRARGYRLMDIQQLTPHLARMGAEEIPRPQFLRRVQQAVALPVSFGQTLSGAETSHSPD